MFTKKNSIFLGLCFCFGGLAFLYLYTLQNFNGFQLERSKLNDKTKLFNIKLNSLSSNTIKLELINQLLLPQFYRKSKNEPEVIPKDLRKHVYFYHLRKSKFLHFDKGIHQKKDIKRLFLNLQSPANVFSKTISNIFPSGMDVGTLLSPKDKISPIIYHTKTLHWHMIQRSNEYLLTFVDTPSIRLKQLLNFYIDLEQQNSSYHKISLMDNSIKVRLNFASIARQYLGLVLEHKVSILILFFLILAALKFHIFRRLEWKFVWGLTLSLIASYLLSLILFGLASNQIIYSQYQRIRLNYLSWCRSQFSEFENHMIQSRSNAFKIMENRLEEKVANKKKTSFLKALFDEDGNLEVLGQTGKLLSMYSHGIAIRLISMLRKMNVEQEKELETKFLKGLDQNQMYWTSHRSMKEGWKKVIFPENKGKLIRSESGLNEVYWRFDYHYKNDKIHGSFSIIPTEHIYGLQFRTMNWNQDLLVGLLRKGKILLLNEQPEFLSQLRQGKFIQGEVQKDLIPGYYSCKLPSLIAPDLELLFLFPSSKLERQIKDTQEQINNVILLFSAIYLLSAILFLIRTNLHFTNLNEATSHLLGHGRSRQVTSILHDEFHRAHLSLYDASFELEKRKNVAPFVANRLIDLLKDEHGNYQQELLGKATVLFSDIRDFTTLSNQIDPQTIVDMLNDYFQIWQEEVNRHGGIIERFIGDAVVVIFHAHLDENHPQSALETGISVLKKLQVFNERRKRSELFTISAGIGISTGNIRTKILGNEVKKHIVSIGEPVHLAEELEGKTKGMALPVLVDQETSMFMEHSFDWQHVGDEIFTIKSGLKDKLFS